MGAAHTSSERVYPSYEGYIFDVKERVNVVMRCKKCRVFINMDDRVSNLKDHDKCVDDKGGLKVTYELRNFE